MAFLAFLFHWQIVFSYQRILPFVILILILFSGVVLFYSIILFPFLENKDPFVLIANRVPGGDFLLRIYLAFKSYQNQWKVLAVALVVSIVNHSLIAYLFLLIGNMIGIKNINLAIQMFIMPVGLLTTSIPLAPAGIGVGHVAFEALYMIAGTRGGADVFNLYIILEISVSLLGGVIYLSYKNENKIV
jgi:glycosyltransferase 2 family protein